MSGNGRPNLNGLFSGTTAPDRSSHVADTLGPRPISPMRADPPSGTPGIPQRRNEVPKRGLPARKHDPLMEWFDPVRAAERYFGIVQAVVDVNRELAVGLAKAVSALTRRDGNRR